MHEERIAWILDQACERLFGRESSGSIAVARAARRAVRPLPPNFSTSKSLRPSLSRALAHASDTAGWQLRSIWWPARLLVSFPIAPGFGQAMANRKANTT